MACAFSALGGAILMNFRFSRLLALEDPLADDFDLRIDRRLGLRGRRCGSALEFFLQLLVAHVGRGWRDRLGGFRGIGVEVDAGLFRCDRHAEEHVP